MDSEKRIEALLVQAVKKRGGLALKFVSPGNNGVPDRILLFPGGVVAFVEVKAPGKKLRALQINCKRKFESLGFQVYCLDNKNDIEVMLDEIYPV